MSISQSRNDGNRITLPIIVSGSIAALLVIIAIVFVTYRHFSAPPGPPAAVQQTSQQQENLMIQMAQKCHGDFNQLSPEDQAKVQQLSRGQGIGAIADVAMQHNIH